VLNDVTQLTQQVVLLSFAFLKLQALVDFLQLGHIVA
jgi:hypothetical protein